jgi:PIN domain nuclease of toxin-antitoxin system
VGDRALIVLDTHAWLWWVSEPARLGRSARRVLRDAKRIGVPAICCLEVAVAAARGRISLDRDPLDWMLEALALRGVELLPLLPAVAVRAAALPAGFPGDRADRLIVATAQCEAAPLVTKDDRLRGQPGLETVWS